MGWIRWGVALLLLALVPATSAVARPSLIPMPVSVAWHDGGFPITARTVVEGHGDAASTATYLSQALSLERIKGLKGTKGGPSRIRLMLVPDTVIAGQEAYRLTVSRNEIRIQASHPSGLFYGAQTLRQLVTRTSSGSRTVPAVDISDAPRFRWRGLLVDVSRHFFGKPALLRIIDEMAA